MNSERVRALQRDMLLVGVDGGASGFRAHEIVLRETAAGLRFALGENSAAERIEVPPNFAAKSIELQREEARRGTYAISPEERELQGRWVAAASRAIWRVASRAGPKPLYVGICSPGLKTPDGRGIQISLNGPRIPDFIDALEQSLILDGLNLGRPIARLSSDGAACGVGESLAEHGALCGVAHGYYIGGGSGVAEAFKLAGVVREADALGIPLEKAWQLRADDGLSFEQHLSVSGLNRDFGLTNIDDVEVDSFPEHAAAAGDGRALGLFGARAQRLAELACSRLLALHAQCGVSLERVVVGQRLGLLLLDARLEACFAAPARAALAAQLAARAPADLRERWNQDGALRAGRLVGSRLSAAPALGALALALEAEAG